MIVVNDKRLSLQKCAVLLATCFLFLVLAGCGKIKNIQVYTYEENPDGTLIITGLTEKGKGDRTLNIPSEINGKTVSQIGREAFRDDINVEKIVIPDSIIKISENAFLNCTILENIEFPSSLEQIGTNAVKNTIWEKNWLAQNKEIVICDILVEAGDIEGVYEIPKEVKVIASGAFYNNKKITDVVMPDGLKCIEAYAFAGCDNIVSLKVPEGVAEIGIEAFLDVAQVEYAGNAQGTPWGAKNISK